MGRKKNKNKNKKMIRPLNLRWFPGYDLYITIAIMLLVAILATCTGCYSPDTVYVREYHRPSPFSSSLFIHHDNHYSHHHSHHRHNDRRSSRPTHKVITPTRNPAPPPSRPIGKGVPEPPSSPRDRR